MKTFLVIIYIFSLQAFCTPVNSSFLQKTQKKLSLIKNISSTLSITTNIKSIDEINTINAKFLFLRPNLFKLEFKDKTIAFNNEYLWNYSKMNNQVLINKNTANVLPFDLEEILFNFTVNYKPTFTRDTIISKQKCKCFNLSNNNFNSQNINKLETCVNTNSKLPSLINIEFKNGNISSYKFNKIDTKTKINKNSFNHNYPNAEIFEIP